MAKRYDYTTIIAHISGPVLRQVGEIEDNEGAVMTSPLIVVKDFSAEFEIADVASEYIKRPLLTVTIRSDDRERLEEICENVKAMGGLSCTGQLTLDVHSDMCEHHLYTTADAVIPVRFETYAS